MRGIDEVNNKYGHLLVLERDIHNIKKDRIYWKCLCECGHIVTARGSHLRDGNVQSCGCYQKEQTSVTHIKNEINHKYGKLTVLNKNSKGAYWDCLCECGQMTTVLGSNLRNGNTKSCGCLKSKGEMEISNLLSLNNIPFIKEYTFLDLKSPKGSPLRFDFAILIHNKLHYLIEFDGAQHFIEKEHWGGTAEFNKLQEYDKLKNNYCLNHSISLIRIKYNEMITLDKLMGGLKIE